MNDLATPAATDLMAVYRSVQTRTRRKGRLVPSPVELAAAVASLDPRCQYCQVDARSLRRLRLHDRFGRPVKRLTLALIDPGGDYAFGNVEWACFKCIEVREFTTRSEAMELGTYVAAVWRNRLSRRWWADDAPGPRPTASSQSASPNWGCSRRS